MGQLVLPRAPSQKVLACIAIILLNPLTEEAMFRGVLVYHFSNTSGYVILPLVLGFAANVFNHTHQGARLQVFHACFFAVAVALLYSPLGLLGAIGFHFGGDLVPIITARRRLLQYRARNLRRSSLR